MNRLIALGLTALAIGCYRSPTEHTLGGPITLTQTFTGSHPINVVCTTGMVADLVRNIGGAQVKVEQLMAAGVDPHLYTESLEDIGRLEAADLVFFSGLHLEGQMGNTLVRMARTKPTFAVTEYIEPKLLLKSEGAYDPHVWFDVSLWSKAAGVVRDVLVAYDAKNAGNYRERADAYQKELAVLHDEVKEQMATIPKAQRVLVTAHDAFQYFGRAYGIEVRGIQGISTDAEASVKDIRELVQFITSRKIKAVFVESSVNKDNVQALIAGSRDAGHQVDIGGELFSDAMGVTGTEEGTYAGMVRHNMRTIVNGLK